MDKKNSKIFIIVGFLVIICVIWILIENYQKHKYNEIQIGAILPMTGDLAFFGEQARNGLKLAEQMINDSGGINGCNLKILLEDGKGIPVDSISAFHSLTVVDSVKIILSIISSVDLAILPKVVKKDILFISHATHPAISKQGTNIFRHSNTVDQEIDKIINFLPPNTKKIVIAYMNDDYGTSFNELFRREMNKKVNEIASIIFERGERDFQLIATKIVNSKPDYLIVCGTGRNLSQLPIRLKTLKFKGKIIFTLGFIASGANKLVSEIINNNYGIDFDFDRTSKGYFDLNKRYQAEFGTDIPTGSIIFFNTVWLLKKAINDAGDDNPTAIINKLNSIKAFQGMGETMEINLKNDILPKLKILKFKSENDK